MKCANDRELITRWINNEMTEAERKVFELHLLSCTECSQELEAEQKLWNMVGELPVPAPSADMRVRFDSMLEEFKQKQERKTNPFAAFGEKLRQLWSLQPGMQVAYTIVLVVVGLSMGMLLNRRDPDVKILTEEVRQMKAEVITSLLQNPSASERIRGVSFTSEIKKANREVIDALFTTLNNDENVNVRLVTLEALTQYAGDPHVRQGLVQSIVEQDSPLLQAALADVMLELQEKGSVQSFRKLLQQKNLDTTIRGKIEQTITKLI